VIVAAVVALYLLARQVSMEAFVEWFKGVQTILAYMALTFPMAIYQVFGMVLMIAVIWLFWRAQRSPRDVNRFDVVDMFIDDNGKTSSGSVFKVVGGFFGIWIMGWLTISDKMTEGYFAVFLAAYFGAKPLQTVADKWKGGSEQAPIIDRSRAPDPRGKP
jgi:hypothetical protein